MENAMIPFMENVLLSLYLLNLAKEEEIKQLLLKNDIDMTPRDELMLLKFDHER